MSWSAADVPTQTGRRVVVTGANSGIGREVTRVLAERGATVVMACRDLERARAAAAEIAGGDPPGELVTERLDLASLASVAAFADRLAGTRIDVLVNNAGVMAIPRRETDDGFERQFGVNHLGHFALTGLLLESIASDGRIVTVSSGLHRRGEIDFDDPMGEASYGPWSAYAQSKLANLLFAYELDRRLGLADTATLSVAAHPGYASTGLQLRGPRMRGSRLRALAHRVANALVAQSAADGALPILYAATASDVDGGSYYGPGGLLNMRGPPTRQEAAPQSRDREVARELWSLSESLTGVSVDLPEPSPGRTP